MEEQKNTKKAAEKTEKAKPTTAKQTKKAEEKKEYKSVLHSGLCKEFFEKHDIYKEQSLTDRRFKHKDIAVLINRFSNVSDFKIKSLGKSVEGREINQIKIGRGKIKVLLWSQMHGDEPTGTAAIFDVLNFFLRKDEYSEIKDQILNNLSLYFVPMLNPDGAEKFKRRNALEVDLNRDAITSTSPEAKILNKLRSDILPDFAFNLHDHNHHYRVEGTQNPTVISLLSPSFDEKGSVNTIRRKSMKLVVGLSNLLEKYIPGHIAKFKPTFDARCFGDHFQKAGTSTVLIESGNILDDTEKQEVRKINFMLLVCGLISIAEGSYEEEDVKAYDKIPFVKQDYFDLLIRNAKLKRNDKFYSIDIGIDRDEVTILDGENDKYWVKSNIRDLGDLSVYSAFEEFNAKGYEVERGKVFPQVINSIRSLKKVSFESFVDMLKLGYTTLMLKKMPYGTNYSELPINLVAVNTNVDNCVKEGNLANFVLRKHGQVKAVVVNGQFFSLENL